jgi:tight adherence protein B
MQLSSNLFLVGIGLFLMSIVIIELTRYAVRHFRSVERIRIRKRIKRYSDPSKLHPKEDLDIVRSEVMSDIPILNRLMLNIPILKSLNRMTSQANSKFPLGVYILLSLLFLVLLYLGILSYMHNRILALIAGLLGMVIPFLYLMVLRRKRLDKFRAQLPEGLELMARALKAGHALSGSMDMVGKEFSDPLGTEFRETLDEINFGVSVPEALKNFAVRVECAEANFFVVAMILQRETGGNLAELLENLADLLRKKFEFYGKVRTLSAESKLSAVILVMLPFFIGAYFQISSPGYLNPLFVHPFGQKVLVVCGVLMLLGIVTLAKMVDIKI